MLVNFNSIKVRLEQNSKELKPVLFEDFNSIKVRLELNGNGRGVFGSLGFQFHKGTIRTK